MRIDTVFITLGLFLLLAGMVFGAWMGAQENFEFAGAHAHLNLLGFVTAVLYGLIHRAYPSLRESRLAWPQCILHFVGVAVFVPGIVLVVTHINLLVVVIGSALVMLALLLFIVMFLSRADRATST